MFATVNLARWHKSRRRGDPQPRHGQIRPPFPGHRRGAAGGGDSAGRTPRFEELDALWEQVKKATPAIGRTMNKTACDAVQANSPEPQNGPAQIHVFHPSDLHLGDLRPRDALRQRHDLQVQPGARLERLQRRPDRSAHPASARHPRRHHPRERRHDGRPLQSRHQTVGAFAGTYTGARPRHRWASPRTSAATRSSTRKPTRRCNCARRRSA